MTFSYAVTTEPVNPPRTLRKVYNGSLTVGPSIFSFPRDPNINVPSFFNSVGGSGGLHGALGFYNSINSYSPPDSAGLQMLGGLTYFTITPTGIFDVTTPYMQSGLQYPLYTWQSGGQASIVPGRYNFFTGSMNDISGTNPRKNHYNLQAVPYPPIVVGNTSIPFAIHGAINNYQTVNQDGSVPFQSNVYTVFDDYGVEHPTFYMAGPINAFTRFTFCQYDSVYFGNANGGLPSPIVIVKDGNFVFVVNPGRKLVGTTNPLYLAVDPVNAMGFAQGSVIYSGTTYKLFSQTMICPFTWDFATNITMDVPGPTPYILEDATDNADIAVGFGSMAVLPNGNFGYLTYTNSGATLTLFVFGSDLQTYGRITIKPTQTFGFTFGGGDPGNWAVDLLGNFWFISNNYRGVGYSGLFTSFGLDRPIVDIIPPILTGLGISCRNGQNCIVPWIG